MVANAGLILPATLALHLGLPQLVDRHLDLGDAPGRANPGDKISTLVTSALAGGDCIDANRAHELMLVNHVAEPEDVMPMAEEIARKIVANAPLSLAAIKESSIMGAAMDLERRVAFAQMKRDVVLHTEDAAEGVKPSPKNAPRSGKAANPTNCPLTTAVARYSVPLPGGRALPPPIRKGLVWSGFPYNPRTSANLRRWNLGSPR